jgi:hypothetical protein
MGVITAWGFDAVVLVENGLTILPASVQLDVERLEEEMLEEENGNQ